MEKLSKITVPASEKLRQIQKIVQDIKKNDDSIFNRLKRLTNNKPPKVPARDYPGDNQDSEQSSDSDFDNDLYEDPQGDYNYEPPPCERSFNPARKINYPGGDYLDARPGRQMQTKPMMPFLPNKPPIPEKPKQAAKYDMSMRFLTRCSSKLQSPALQLPPKPSPRYYTDNNRKCRTLCPHNTSYEETIYLSSFSPAGSKEDREERKSVEERRPSIPVPLPREVNRAFHLETMKEAGVYKKPWYASNCDRKTAEDTLARSAKDGSYMVRKSSGVDALQPYTLVVFYNGRVYNIPVRYILATKQYALGKQKNREERFKTVSEIIENHQRNTLVLVDMQSNTKDSTTLKHAIKP
ncbi:B-cell linker protein [Silurus asotus]|uniref:B-cell linker protein n=1 Tax=Silurus asotus TaxID=30991 RepID=A0AAD5FJ67_SILAS|nr:B-cell linker protein [Silurus asotus]